MSGPLDSKRSLTLSKPSSINVFAARKSPGEASGKGSLSSPQAAGACGGTTQQLSKAPPTGLVIAAPKGAPRRFSSSPGDAKQPAGGSAPGEGNELLSEAARELQRQARDIAGGLPAGVLSSPLAAAATATLPNSPTNSLPLHIKPTALPPHISTNPDWGRLQQGSTAMAAAVPAAEALAAVNLVRQQYGVDKPAPPVASNLQQLGRGGGTRWDMQSEAGGQGKEEECGGSGSKERDLQAAVGASGKSSRHRDGGHKGERERGRRRSSRSRSRSKERHKRHRRHHRSRSRSRSKEARRRSRSRERRRPSKHASAHGSHRSRSGSREGRPSSARHPTTATAAADGERRLGNGAGGSMLRVPQGGADPRGSRLQASGRPGSSAPQGPGADSSESELPSPPQPQQLGPSQGAGEMGRAASGSGHWYWDAQQDRMVFSGAKSKLAVQAGPESPGKAAAGAGATSVGARPPPNAAAATGANKGKEGPVGGAHAAGVAPASGQLAAEGRKSSSRLAAAGRAPPAAAPAGAAAATPASAELPRPPSEPKVGSSPFRTLGAAAGESLFPQYGGLVPAYTDSSTSSSSEEEDNGAAAIRRRPSLTLQPPPQQQQQQQQQQRGVPTGAGSSPMQADPAQPAPQASPPRAEPAGRPTPVRAATGVSPTAAQPAAEDATPREGPAAGAAEQAGQATKAVPPTLAAATREELAKKEATPPQAAQQQWQEKEGEVLPASPLHAQPPSTSQVEAKGSSPAPAVAPVPAQAEAPAALNANASGDPLLPPPPPEPTAQSEPTGKAAEAAPKPLPAEAGPVSDAAAPEATPAQQQEQPKPLQPEEISGVAACPAALPVLAPQGESGRAAAAVEGIPAPEPRAPEGQPQERGQPSAPPPPPPPQTHDAAGAAAPAVAPASTAPAMPPPEQCIPRQASASPAAPQAAASLPPPQQLATNERQLPPVVAQPNPPPPLANAPTEPSAEGPGEGPDTSKPAALVPRRTSRWGQRAAAGPPGPPPQRTEPMQAGDVAEGQAQRQPPGPPPLPQQQAKQALEKAEQQAQQQPPAPPALPQQQTKQQAAQQAQPPGPPPHQAQLKLQKDKAEGQAQQQARQQSPQPAQGGQQVQQAERPRTQSMPAPPLLPGVVWAPPELGGEGEVEYEIWHAEAYIPEDFARGGGLKKKSNIPQVGAGGKLQHIGSAPAVSQPWGPFSGAGQQQQQQGGGSVPHQNSQGPVSGVPQWQAGAGQGPMSPKGSGPRPMQRAAPPGHRQVSPPALTPLAPGAAPASTAAVGLPLPPPVPPPPPPPPGQQQPQPHGPGAGDASEEVCPELQHIEAAEAKARSVLDATEQALLRVEEDLRDAEEALQAKEGGHRSLQALSSRLPIPQKQLEEAAAAERAAQERVVAAQQELARLKAQREAHQQEHQCTAAAAAALRFRFSRFVPADVAAIGTLGGVCQARAARLLASRMAAEIYQSLEQLPKSAPEHSAKFWRLDDVDGSTACTAGEIARQLHELHEEAGRLLKQRNKQVMEQPDLARPQAQLGAAARQALPGVAQQVKRGQQQKQQPQAAVTAAATAAGRPPSKKVAAIDLLQTSLVAAMKSQLRNVSLAQLEGALGALLAKQAQQPAQQAGAPKLTAIAAPDGASSGPAGTAQPKAGTAGGKAAAAAAAASTAVTTGPAPAAAGEGAEGELPGKAKPRKRLRKAGEVRGHSPALDGSSPAPPPSNAPPPTAAAAEDQEGARAAQAGRPDVAASSAEPIAAPDSAPAPAAKLWRIRLKKASEAHKPSPEAVPAAASVGEAAGPAQAPSAVNATPAATAEPTAAAQPALSPPPPAAGADGATPQGGSAPDLPAVAAQQPAERGAQGASGSAAGEHGPATHPLPARPPTEAPPAAPAPAAIPSSVPVVGTIPKRGPRVKRTTSRAPAAVPAGSGGGSGGSGREGSAGPGPPAAESGHAPAAAEAAGAREEGGEGRERSASPPVDVPVQPLEWAAAAAAPAEQAAEAACERASKAHAGLAAERVAGASGEQTAEAAGERAPNAAAERAAKPESEEAAASVRAAAAMGTVEADAAAEPPAGPSGPAAAAAPTAGTVGGGAQAGDAPAPGQVFRAPVASAKQKKRASKSPFLKMVSRASMSSGGPSAGSECQAAASAPSTTNWPPASTAGGDTPTLAYQQQQLQLQQEQKEQQPSGQHQATPESVGMLETHTGPGAQQEPSSSAAAQQRQWVQETLGEEEQSGQSPEAVAAAQEIAAGDAAEAAQAEDTGRQQQHKRRVGKLSAVAAEGAGRSVVNTMPSAHLQSPADRETLAEAAATEEEEIPRQAEESLAGRGAGRGGRWGRGRGGRGRGRGGRKRGRGGSATAARRVQYRDDSEPSELYAEDAALERPAKRQQRGRQLLHEEEEPASAGAVEAAEAVEALAAGWEGQLQHQHHHNQHQHQHHHHHHQPSLGKHAGSPASAHANQPISPRLQYAAMLHSQQEEALEGAQQAAAALPPSKRARIAAPRSKYWPFVVNLLRDLKLAHAQLAAWGERPPPSSLTQQQREELMDSGYAGGLWGLPWDPEVDGDCEALIPSPAALPAAGQGMATRGATAAAAAAAAAASSDVAAAAGSQQVGQRGSATQQRAAGGPGAKPAKPPVPGKGGSSRQRGGGGGSRAPSPSGGPVPDSNLWGSSWLLPELPEDSQGGEGRAGAGKAGRPPPQGKRPKKGPSGSAGTASGKPPMKRQKRAGQGLASSEGQEAPALPKKPLPPPVNSAGCVRALPFRELRDMKDRQLELGGKAPRLALPQRPHQQQTLDPLLAHQHMALGGPGRMGGGRHKSTAATVSSKSTGEQVHFVDWGKLMQQVRSERPKIKLNRSSTHGWGMFATEDIGPNQFVIEYRGELITHALADLREKRYWESHGTSCMYLFTLEGTPWVIDATHKGNAARYVNHSCEPNCKALTVEDTAGGGRHVCIYTGERGVRAGEELAYDYKLMYEPTKEPAPCYCNTPSCIGRMDRPPEGRR